MAFRFEVIFFEVDCFERVDLLDVSDGEFAGKSPNRRGLKRGGLMRGNGGKEEVCSVFDGGDEEGDEGGDDKEG